MLVVFAVWALWEIGAMGGTDAKIIITLVLFFSNGLLFIPIVLLEALRAGCVDSPEKDHPYTVSIALGTAAWLFLIGYL
jgi:Flp pilus assembly protein protease CpaA